MDKIKITKHVIETETHLKALHQLIDPKLTLRGAKKRNFISVFLSFYHFSLHAKNTTLYAGYKPMTHVCTKYADSKICAIIQKNTFFHETCFVLFCVMFAC